MVDVKSKLHRDQRRLVLTDPKGVTYAVRTPNELWDLMWSLTTDPAFQATQSQSIARRAPERVEAEVIEAEIVDVEQGSLATQRRGPVQSIGMGPGHESHHGHGRRSSEQRIPFVEHGPARSPEDIVTEAVIDGGIRAAQSLGRGIARLSFRGKTRQKGNAQEIERKIREQRKARRGGG